MLKTAFIALTLMLSPVAVIAEGCEHEQQTASCADGQTWDYDKATCVPIVSS